MEILGWVANALFFTGGTFKSPRKTIAAYSLADFLFIVLYIHLDLHLAALAMGITGLRALLTLVLNDKNNLYAVIFLTLLSSLVILFKAEHYTDLLVLFAAISIGISCYYRDNFILFRLLTSLSQVLWIIHSLIFGVYSMVFACLIILGTNIGALLYYTDVKDIILNQVGLGRSRTIIK